MAKQKRIKEDPYKSRKEYELDVDRMISEGMAGGTTHSVHGRMQIEQASDLPKEDEPFPPEDS